MQFRNLFVIVALGAGFSAFAAKEKAPLLPDLTLPDVADVLPDPTVSAERLKAHADRRKPARLAPKDEKDMSPKLIEFRDEFLKVKSAEELEKLLVKANKNYDSYPLDLQFFVAQAQLARPFRSFAFRTRPIFEQRKYRTVQSMTVASIRGMAEDLRLFVPTQQWEAMFEYVTAPFPAANPNDAIANNKVFGSIQDIQAHFLSAAPEFNLALKRLKTIYRVRPKNKPIVFDQKLFYGPGSFPDDLDRYAAYGDAEIAATLATIHHYVHSVYVFAAYNQDDLLEVVYKVGRLSGLDGFELWGDIGPTSAEEKKVLDEYPNFLVAKNWNAKVTNDKLMEDSLAHLRAFVGYSTDCWNFLKNEKNGVSRFAIMSPVEWRGEERQINIALKVWNEMVNGPTAVKSVVTGETIDFNMRAFFEDPSQDLKEFFPQTFQLDTQEKTTNLGDGKQAKYRNYFYGRAIGWNGKAWARYSADVKNTDLKTSPDPQRLIRIMNQSFGSDWITSYLYYLAK